MTGEGNAGLVLAQELAYPVDDLVADVLVHVQRRQVVSLSESRCGNVPDILTSGHQLSRLLVDASGEAVERERQRRVLVRSAVAQ